MQTVVQFGALQNMFGKVGKNQRLKEICSIEKVH